MIEFSDKELETISEVLDTKPWKSDKENLVNDRLLAYLKKHNWECVSPGGYDSYYKCKVCGLGNMEQADNPDETRNPTYGCPGVKNNA